MLRAYTVPIHQRSVVGHRVVRVPDEVLQLLELELLELVGLPALRGGQELQALPRRAVSLSCLAGPVRGRGDRDGDHAGEVSFPVAWARVRAHSVRSIRTLVDGVLSRWPGRRTDGADAARCVR